LKKLAWLTGKADLEGLRETKKAERFLKKDLEVRKETKTFASRKERKVPGGKKKFERLKSLKGLAKKKELNFFKTFFGS
jgi:hypothetical protein